MDIHRCRFVPYPSSTINALSFSHPSSINAKTRAPPNLRSAVGRANGDIEVWNLLKGAWCQESVLRGGKDRGIEGLVWIKDPDDVDKKGYKIPGRLRLFSIGYSQAVTEWDLAAGKPLQHSSGNHGEIWCMAAQPKGITPTRKATMSDEDYAILEKKAQIQTIAVGCADGSIVLISTDDGDLRFNKVLARPSKKSTRVLSVTFQNRHSIIAGHADSTIRIYDIRGGQQIRQMTLGAGPKGGPKETLVWSVKALLDGTIVSGDSTGTVSFWDGKQYALLQRIKAHDADVLDLAVSADGKSVFSGGMDRRTILYRKNEGRGSREKARWAKVSHQRPHQNDVKAMATYEAKGLSVLVSGGLDTYPIVMPIQEFGKEYHRRLPSLPQQPSLTSAPKARLVVSWWDRELSIWSLSKSAKKSEPENGDGNDAEIDGRKLVAKITLQGDESITSADVSGSGDILAVSTVAEIKLFRLRPKQNILKVQKVPMPSQSAHAGAKRIHLSPDRRWLVAIRSKDIVQMLRIVEQTKKKQGIEILPNAVVLKRLSRTPTHQTHLHGSLGSYDRSIMQVAFSLDSRILAVGDLAGYIDTWVLEGHEDLTQETEQMYAANGSLSSSDSDFSSSEEKHPSLILGQHWIRNPSGSLIPKLSTSPLILSFRPSRFAPTSVGNGTPGLHPTRHNPHPRSHDLPHGEARLFIITSDNAVREIDVLKGKLTDWSRRNPPSCFPPEYQKLKDRAKGIVWDTQGQNERAWLYGVNWLWMFDLAQDLPLAKSHQQQENAATPKAATQNGNAHQNRKRKRVPDFTAAHHSSTDAPRHPHRNTGAGDRIRDSDLSTGIGSRITKTTGADGEKKHIHLHPHQPTDSSDEEDADADNETTLLSLRRSEGRIALSPERHHMNGDRRDGTDDTGGDDDDDNDGGNGDHGRVSKPRPAFWHTYKYRPILGIVPLESGEEEGGSNGVEVALVERPLWDMEHLPAAYSGAQEWGR